MWKTKEDDMSAKTTSRTANEYCDCGHRRLAHTDAFRGNDGGNDCIKCDCPLFTARPQNRDDRPVNIDSPTEILEAVAEAFARTEQIAAEIANDLRETADELRHGMHPHHAANRLMNIADRISARKD
jgi:Zn-finger protein